MNTRQWWTVTKNIYSMLLLKYIVYLYISEVHFLLNYIYLIDGFTSYFIHSNVDAQYLLKYNYVVQIKPSNIIC